MLIFKAVLITKCRSLRRLDAREGGPVHGLANQEHLIMCVFANTAAVTNADPRRFSSTMLLQSYIYTSLNRRVASRRLCRRRMDKPISICCNSDIRPNLILLTMWEWHPRETHNRSKFCNVFHVSLSCQEIPSELSVLSSSHYRYFVTPILLADSSVSMTREDTRFLIHDNPVYIYGRCIQLASP